VIISPKGMSSKELQAGYTQIKDQTYSYQSILSRSLPHLFSGAAETMLYFSLNNGARKWHRTGLTAVPFENRADMPVDFDVTKYVTPVKEAMLT